MCKQSRADKKPLHLTFRLGYHSGLILESGWSDEMEPWKFRNFPRPFIVPAYSDRHIEAMAGREKPTRNHSISLFA